MSVLNIRFSWFLIPFFFRKPWKIMHPKHTEKTIPKTSFGQHHGQINNEIFSMRIPHVIQFWTAISVHSSQKFTTKFQNFPLLIVLFFIIMVLQAQIRILKNHNDPPHFHIQNAPRVRLLKSIICIWVIVTTNMGATICVLIVNVIKKRGTFENEENGFMDRVLIVIVHFFPRKEPARAMLVEKPFTRKCENDGSRCLARNVGWTQRNSKPIQHGFCKTHVYFYAQNLNNWRHVFPANLNNVEHMLNDWGVNYVFLFYFFMISTLRVWLRLRCDIVSWLVMRSSWEYISSNFWNERFLINSKTINFCIIHFSRKRNVQWNKHVLLRNPKNFGK